MGEEQKEILSAFFNRRKIFDTYIKDSGLKLFTCPGCAFPTLPLRGGYEICIVCNWEDDDQDDPQADEVWGGPNGNLSLTENRLNIGRQLKEIAEKEGGKINDEPKTVLSILSNYDSKLHDILDQVQGDTDINDPIFSQYHQMGQDLLVQLVIK